MTRRMQQVGAAGLTTQSVRQSTWPEYPTRLQVQSRPDLLVRHRPASWRSHPELATAAAAFLAANMAGCDTKGGRATSRPALSPDAPAIVAPVFQRGEGRGAIGCIVANPPVFVSEAEALQMIIEELSSHGITARSCDSALAGVSIPLRRTVYDYEWTSADYDRHVAQSAETKPIIPDLQCDTACVAIEYISREDHETWAGPLASSSVIEYDLPEAAAFVGAQVRRQAHGTYFVALYDPLSEPGKDYEQPYQERRAAAHAQSELLLRQQVRDLVDWLKAQGVI